MLDIAAIKHFFCIIANEFQFFGSRLIKHVFERIDSSLKLYYCC